MRLFIAALLVAISYAQTVDVHVKICRGVSGAGSSQTLSTTVDRVTKKAYKPNAGASFKYTFNVNRGKLSLATKYKATDGLCIEYVSVNGKHISGPFWLDWCEDGANYSGIECWGWKKYLDIPIDCVYDEFKTKNSCPATCGTIPGKGKPDRLTSMGKQCPSYDCQPGDGDCPYAVDCVLDTAASANTCTVLCGEVAGVPSTMAQNGGEECSPYQCQIGDGACLPVDCVTDSVASAATCTDACGTVNAVGSEAMNGGLECPPYECKIGDGLCQEEVSCPEGTTFNEDMKFMYKGQAVSCSNIVGFCGKARCNDELNALFTATHPCCADKVDCVLNEKASASTCSFTCDPVPGVGVPAALNGGEECPTYDCQPGDGICPTPRDCYTDRVATRNTCTEMCGFVPPIVDMPARHGGADCPEYECQKGDGACPDPVDCVMGHYATLKTCTSECGFVRAIGFPEARDGGKECAPYECQPGDGECPMGEPYFSVDSVDCADHPNGFTILKQNTDLNEGFSIRFNFTPTNENQAGDIVRLLNDAGNELSFTSSHEGGFHFAAHIRAGNQIITDETSTHTIQAGHTYAVHVAFEKSTQTVNVKIDNDMYASGVIDSGFGIFQHVDFCNGVGGVFDGTISDFKLSTRAVLEYYSDVRCMWGPMFHLIHDRSVEECAVLCEENLECTSFEYGMNLNHDESETRYSPRDCLLVIGMPGQDCNNLVAYSRKTRKGKRRDFSNMSLSVQEMPFSMQMSTLLFAFIGFTTIIVTLFKSLFKRKSEEYAVIEEHSEI